MKTEIEIVQESAALLDERQAKANAITAEIERLSAWTQEAQAALAAENEAARVALQQLALETLQRRPAAPWWRRLLSRNTAGPSDPRVFEATLQAARDEHRKLGFDLERAEADVQESASAAAWLRAAYATKAATDAGIIFADLAEDAQALAAVVRPHPILPVLPAVLVPPGTTPALRRIVLDTDHVTGQGGTIPAPILAELAS